MLFTELLLYSRTERFQFCDRRSDAVLAFKPDAHINAHERPQSSQKYVGYWRSALMISCSILLLLLLLNSRHTYTRVGREALLASVKGQQFQRK